MKAIICRSYGPPENLRCEEVRLPTIDDDQVLIRVRAASVNPLDWHIMRGSPYMVRLLAGLRTPKRAQMGVNVAGRVEAVGRSVTKFKSGDDVFGICRGAFAEFAAAAASAIVVKPHDTTDEQAASVPVAAMWPTARTATT